jgi:hypothetical protein
MMARHVERIAVKGCIALIRVYKLCVAPVLGAQCRFTPTCSTYALHALQTYRLPKALLLVVWRLLRCHPFCAGGYDPV